MSASPSPEHTLPSAPAGGATQADLSAQAFGEGSDLSDLSDSDDDQVPRPRLAFPSRPAARPRSVSEEDEDRDDDDAYVPATTSEPAKIPRFKKVSRDAEEDVEDEGEGRKRKKKKRRMESGRRRQPREEVEEEPAPVYDAETRKSRPLSKLVEEVWNKRAGLTCE